MLWMSRPFAQLLYWIEVIKSGLFTYIPNIPLVIKEIVAKPILFVKGVF